MLYNRALVILSAKARRMTLLRLMRRSHQLPVISRQADIVRRSFTRLLLPATLAGMIAASSVSSLFAQATTLSLLDYHTSVPTKWTPRAPASTMRLAEYVVPTDAQGSAEVVVYFFGQGQGGNVDANLARWKAQFSTSDGPAVPETIVRDSSGAFPITFAEYRGNYRRGIGMGSADSVRAGQTLIAGIAETPRGTLFIQLFGNSARVAEEKPVFLQFVRGLR
jgi:hypothetical protein